jgi:hypothetical protein
MTRVKPLKFRFLGFGKHPKCKKHRIPLVYVDERIVDFVDAALACLFDKAGLPPSELLEGVKLKFHNEVTSFVEGWVYCITVGRGAPVVSRYMDTISNAYLKQLTKKQIKALKKGDDSKPNLVNKTIKDGMDEITIQYTRILKHLRAHSEILIDHQDLKSLSKSLRNFLKDWQKHVLKHNEIMNSPENEREMTLKEIKSNYDQILNVGICCCLLGLNPESKEIKKAKMTAFDRFSAYHDFYKEEITVKFTKSDVRSLIKRSVDLKNYNQKLNIKERDYFLKKIRVNDNKNSEVDKLEEFNDINAENVVNESQSMVMNNEQKCENLTEKDFVNLSRVTVDFIKNIIGVKNDNFNTYKQCMDEKGINSDKIFSEILSEKTLAIVLKHAGFRDKPDKRKNPQGPSKNRLRALDCILVIALILLRCHDYDCLRENIKNKKNIQDKQIRNIIKNYVLILKKINSNFDIEKWLPGAGRYNFIKTKKLVENIGLKKTEKKGILIKPKTEEDFDAIREQHNVKPTDVPLTVKCGKCGYQWATTVNRIKQREGKWCKFCALGIYTFSKTKELVESVGLRKTGKQGVLKSPDNEKAYNEMKEELNCWYCRIPLEVECGLCGNIFPTNAERVQQDHWCPKCAEGLYEQICRWYLEKILSHIFRLKINCPQTRLNEIITHYNKSKYNEIEKKVIKDLIKFGHVDCYCKINICGSTIKLALEYQGRQHYKIVSKFHNTFEDLKHRKLLDKLKRELCKENKVILLEFPYDIDKYMNNNVKIQVYIIKELKENTTIQIPKDLPIYNHNTPEFGQYRLGNFL